MTKNNLEKIKLDQPDAEESETRVSREEIEDYKKDRIREKDILENKKLRLFNKSLKKDIKNRERYAKYLFALICVWLFLVLSLVFLSGCSKVQFQLSDSVLMFLLGTTTLNVVGLFWIVTSYLFQQKQITRKF